MVNGETWFRLYCPDAEQIHVYVFKSYTDDEPELVIDMEKDDDWWVGYHSAELYGYHYGYSIFRHPPSGNVFQPITDHVIADPYSTMVSTTNHYLQYPKTFIHPPVNFEWTDHEYRPKEDPRDLVIYECHVKDLVYHPEYRLNGTGIYESLRTHPSAGISYLKELGVNAVEFLPLQKFAYFEPEFMESTSDGVFNTWNFYGRNHWGYMTSFFFTPETLFASEASTQAGAINGGNINAILELKRLVNELHENGISVIMDVVYNHISQYDLNPLRYIDANRFLRTQPGNVYISDSGVGNDLKTEDPFVQQLIIDSLLYWMREFHIDGFRFDLANVLDWDTIKRIKAELTHENPNIVLIAEPWGGGYDPQGFSYHDWSAWNDQIRNGVKGSDPHHSRGFIFGEWHHDSNRHALENYVCGSLLDKPGGRFLMAKHSVNYLESHDNHTLADFIRIALNPARENTPVEDYLANTCLSTEESRIAKLAAIILFTSQGITMIHEGQEWARSKIIQPSSVNDPRSGCIDHNSYEKDNETNWLDFNEIKLNYSLFDVYTNLIRLRLESPALRKSERQSIHFLPHERDLHLGWIIHGEQSGDRFDYMIALNADRDAPYHLHGTAGWEILYDGDEFLDPYHKQSSDNLKIEPVSALILRKLRT